MDLKKALEVSWLFLSLMVVGLLTGCGDEKAPSEEAPLFEEPLQTEDPDTAAVAESLSVKAPIVKEEARQPKKAKEKSKVAKPVERAKAKTPEKKIEVIKKADPPEKVAVKTPPSTPPAPAPEKEIRKDVYKPEDMPTPKKMEISPETKSVLKEEKKEEALKPPEPAAAVSQDYTKGMEAYKNKNYAKAIEHLSKVPVPDTKKRGDEAREEYVQANYFIGLAQQKQGKLQKAVAAYSKVLQYEPYYPIVHMNQGICFLELRKFGKADDAFDRVIRDQNRIPPEQYDEIMQRTRYFWALTWTRMYKVSKEPDKKDYFMRKAGEKWSEYMAWYGKDSRFANANDQASQYLKILQNP